MGPQEEDKEYFQECQTIIKHEHLESIVEFTGKVKIDDYLPKVDVVVLTSISEAQPLVILEAGAAGIPTIATDVGACREMLEGLDDEETKAKGGAVIPLANPQETATAIAAMFIDPKLYAECSRNIQNRVKDKYDIHEKQNRYKEIYDDLIKMETKMTSSINEQLGV